MTLHRNCYCIMAQESITEEPTEEAGFYGHCYHLVAGPAGHMEDFLYSGDVLCAYHGPGSWFLIIFVIWVQFRPCFMEITARRGEK